MQGLRAVLLRASLLAAAYYRDRSFITWNKKGQGPCTSADLATNEVLQEGLQLLMPEAGWLSEESIDTKERLELDHVWIVDPLDGTQDFIRGNTEFSISVALTKDGIPIMGGVALPATKEIILGESSGGLHFWSYSLSDESSIHPQDPLIQDREFFCSRFHRGFPGRPGAYRLHNVQN